MHPSRAGLLALACSALAVGEVDAYGVPAWTSRPPFLRTSAPLCAAAAMGSDAPVASTMTTTSTTAKQAPRKANVDDWVTLWRLSKPDLPLIAVAFAALLIAAAGEVLTPQLQSAVLNTALSGGVYNLGQPVLQLTLVGVFTALATGIRGFIFWILGSRLVARLREALYASMLAKPQAFHDERAPCLRGGVFWWLCH